MEKRNRCFSKLLFCLPEEFSRKMDVELHTSWLPPNYWTPLNNQSFSIKTWSTSFASRPAYPNRYRTTVGDVRGNKNFEVNVFPEDWVVFLFCTLIPAFWWWRFSIRIIVLSFGWLFFFPLWSDRKFQFSLVEICKSRRWGKPVSKEDRRRPITLLPRRGAVARMQEAERISWH